MKGAPMSHPPAPGTLLPLLENLLNQHLSFRPLRRAMTLPLLGELEIGPESLRLLEDSVEVHLTYQGGRSLPQGRHTLKFRVVRSSPGETELALEKASLGILAKFGGEGMMGRMLAGPLQRWLGEGARMEGGNIVLAHAPLLARLFKRG